MIFYKKIYALTILSVALIFASCDKRSCENVVCGANEYCDFGNCLCEWGYEGADCQDIAALKYVGNYFVSANCPNGGFTGSNQAFISYDQSLVNRITITNLLPTGPIEAYIRTDAENRGNIIYQVESFAGNVEGTGTFDNFSGRGRLVLELQFNINTPQYNECQFTLIKQ